jgi:membrane protein
MFNKGTDPPGNRDVPAHRSVNVAAPPKPDSMSLAQWKDVVARTWRGASDDHIGLIAAGVAFYAFLAFVPLLAATVLTYGLLADRGDVINDMRRLTSIIPPAAAQLVGDQLMELVQSSNSKKGLGVLVALAIALFGTSNSAGSVITALNVASETKETRGFIRLNLLALAITATSVVVILLALVAITVLVDLEGLIPGSPLVVVAIGKIGTYVALWLAGAAAATTLYRFGPSHAPGHPQSWTLFTPGSVFTAFCWLLLTLGFGTYASKIGHYNATYGSLSAVIMMLTWLYLSSYVMLLGAELNAELSKLAQPG